METVPLSEDYFTLNEMYRILESLDGFEADFRIVTTGPVTYYEYSVLSDCYTEFPPDYLVHITEGTHSLVLNAFSAEWMTYRGPGYNGD